MIIAKNLTKIFSQTKALDSINLEIKSGINGLVGPDGAGKTTFLRLCAGLLKQSSGSLEIKSKNIGYMPQTFGLYGELSCRENLRLYAKLNGVKNYQNKIDELLKFANLKDFEDRFAGSLSGGMKQKLAFCATLLKRPELLLLDEPGVGVDPISRAEIWEMVRSLNDICVVWATSYMDEAKDCDRVILLNEGKILYDDEPKKIEKMLENRVFSAIFDDKKIDKREFLTEILGFDNVLDAYLVGSKVKLILSDKNSAFFGHFKDVAFENIKPNFEDAFVDILKLKTKAKSELSGILPPVKIDKNQAIVAKNLTKKFGTFVATNNISFEIKKGEIFGFLGPNGAGKSTTFKMICGLLKKSGGEALIYGKDIYKMKNFVGYMAQKFSLYGNLSPIDNLEFFAGLYGLNGAKKQKQIAKMVEIFGLSPYLKNRVNELSLGLKQRLALSCALIHSPLVLFLDEATSGVDPITRKEFWRHINAISKLGIAVMVTTHLMDEAELCDRVMIINNGSCIAIGTPDSLKTGVCAQTMQDAFISLVKGSQNGAN